MTNDSHFQLIVALGYSTLAGKRDRRDPARSGCFLCESVSANVAAATLAEEAARRSPAGSLALRESEASATKRVARSGNQSLL